MHSVSKHLKIQNFITRRTIFSILVVGIFLIPIYYVAIYGFMTTAEIFRQPPYLLPPNPTLRFYLIAFNTLSRYFLNSIIVSVGSVVLTVSIAAPAAFALAQLRVKRAKFVQFLMAFVQMLPVVTTLIPLFLMYNSVGMVNTRFSVILTLSALNVPFNVIILTAYMKSIPGALLESAYIDGASTLRGFFLLLPIAKPGLATGAMFAFLLSWGDFAVSVSMVSRRSLFPMSVGLFDFIGQYGAEWNVLMAGSMLYTIPSLIVVLYAGRYLISGLTAGAIKS